MCRFQLTIRSRKPMQNEFPFETGNLFRQEVIDDGPLLESIWSHDESRQHVIYTQTYSKSFSPGVRVGYGIVPRDLVGPICESTDVFARGRDLPPLEDDLEAWLVGPVAISAGIFKRQNL